MFLWLLFHGQPPFCVWSRSFWICCESTVRSYPRVDAYFMSPACVCEEIPVSGVSAKEGRLVWKSPSLFSRTTHGGTLEGLQGGTENPEGVCSREVRRRWAGGKERGRKRNGGKFQYQDERRNIDEDRAEEESGFSPLRLHSHWQGWFPSGFFTSNSLKCERDFIHISKNKCFWKMPLTIQYIVVI